MVNSKIKIHNNFDITVISSDNKEVNYKAYNTVTNNLRKELIRFTQNGTSSAFDNMVVGSGTGEPSITDTKLFNPLSYYTATKEEYGVLDDNTCWCRYKIIIEPGDLVGKTITEVGMGSTSTIYTHAMIKDSQGNEVGIYKTDTDKLIIRSTVYMTLNTPSYTQPHGTIRYGQNHIPQYFAWLLLKRNNPSSYGNYFECHAYKPLTTDTCPRSGKGTNTTSKTYDNTNYIGKYQMDITTTQFNNLYIHSLVWNSG